MGKFSHPLYSRLYIAARRPMERMGGAEHRRELLDGLSGRVLEIGAGSGLNFAHYPPAVTGVVAVEPEPHFREKAREAAGTAPVPVRVEPGFADELEFGDGEFDAAVCSLVLCSVPDLPGALAEVQRVIRPGGELRFYEHVRGARSLARVQDVLDPVWARACAGCHINRDAVAAIEQAGFELARVRRFDFTGWLVRPHVLGVARRPARRT